MQEGNVSKPDYLWNGKLWELKQVSSINSLDKQVQKGIKQIKDKPGGLILDFTNSTLNNKEISIGIIDRFNKSIINTLKVIIVKNNNINKILKYKK